MNKHVLLLVSSFKTEKDPRRGGMFQKHLRYYVDAGWTVGLIALKQVDVGFAEQLASGRLYPESRSSGAPVLINPVYASTARHIGFPSRSTIARLTGNGIAKKYISRFGKPDIIHAHGIDDVGVDLLEIEAFSDIPVVVTEHNTKYLSRDPSLATPNRLRVAERASRIMCVSNALRDALTQILQVSEDKFCVVPNIVDLAFFDITRPESGSGMHFLSVVYLQDKKRIDISIDAFASAFRDQNARMSIVGFGPAEADLRDRVARLGMENQIRFLGPLETDKVAEVMATSDCYICSSDLETFAIPCAEALAAGTPVITTRCGGPEDIVDETVGMLVPCDDVPAMENAIRRMADEHTSFPAESLREHCRLRFSPQAVLPMIDAVYENALGVS